MLRPVRLDHRSPFKSKTMKNNIKTIKTLVKLVKAADKYTPDWMRYIHFHNGEVIVCNGPVLIKCPFEQLFDGLCPEGSMPIDVASQLKEIYFEDVIRVPFGQVELEPYTGIEDEKLKAVIPTKVNPVGAVGINPKLVAILGELFEYYTMVFDGQHKPIVFVPMVEGWRGSIILCPVIIPDYQTY